MLGPAFSDPRPAGAIDALALDLERDSRTTRLYSWEGWTRGGALPHARVGGGQPINAQTAVAGSGISLSRAPSIALFNASATAPTLGQLSDETFVITWRAPSYENVVIAADANTVDTDGWMLWMDDNAALNLRMRGTAAANVLTLTSASDVIGRGSEHVIAWSATAGGLVTLWLDGVQVAQGTRTGAVVYGATPLLRLCHTAAVGTIGVVSGTVKQRGEFAAVGLLNGVCTAADTARWTDAGVNGMTQIPDVSIVPATTVTLRYVDPQRGNNANPGTDALPWATTAYAFTNAPDFALIYLSGDFTTGGTTVIANGDRTRKAPVDFAPHPRRSLDLVTDGQSLALRGSDWWRLINLEVLNGGMSFDSVSNGAMGSKHFQLIGCKSQTFYARKQEYTTVAGCEFTGAQAAAKGMMFQGNLGQVAGALGQHYVLIQRTWSHDHFGDCFGSYERMHELIIRDSAFERARVFGSDHADGLQIESPIGLEMTNVLINDVNGSGGAIFLAQSLLSGAVNTPKAAGVLQNVVVIDAHTNGAALGDFQHLMVMNCLFDGTELFGDLKFGTLTDSALFNNLIGKLYLLDGDQWGPWRTNNVVREGYSGTTLTALEQQGQALYLNPALNGDRRLSVRSPVGVGAGLAQLGGIMAPAFDVDNRPRTGTPDIGPAVAA